MSIPPPSLHPPLRAGTAEALAAPSSARALMPPRGAPGGTGQLEAPDREAPRRWAPRTAFGARGSRLNRGRPRPLLSEQVLSLWAVRALERCLRLVHTWSSPLLPEGPLAAELQLVGAGLAAMCCARPLTRTLARITLTLPLPLRLRLPVPVPLAL